MSLQMKEVFFILSTFLSFTLFGHTAEILEKSQTPIALLTIPKSGTTLASKCISLITKKLADFRPLNYLPHRITQLDENTHFSVMHFYTDRIRKLKGIKTIINIRDLRDVALALKHQGIKPRYTNKKIFYNMSSNQKLALYIGKHDSWMSALHQSNLCLQMLELNPQALVIKFENLVGPKGGGTLKKQIQEITKICTFLGVKLSQAEILNIANSLFGGTKTFKKGQIGLWKKFYTNEHVKLFKKKLGSNLIKLGYESDNNW